MTSEVLIDRSGTVVKTCSQGERVLANAIDDALMKWKFVQNFDANNRGGRMTMQPTVFYRWQEEFFENGAAAF